MAELNSYVEICDCNVINFITEVQTSVRASRREVELGKAFLRTGFPAEGMRK